MKVAHLKALMWLVIIVLYLILLSKLFADNTICYEAVFDIERPHVLVVTKIAKGEIEKTWEVEHSVFVKFLDRNNLIPIPEKTELPVITIPTPAE